MFALTREFHGEQDILTKACLRQWVRKEVRGLLVSFSRFRFPLFFTVSVVLHIFSFNSFSKS
jgi:hypothetical protein